MRAWLGLVVGLLLMVAAGLVLGTTREMPGHDS